MALTIRRVCFIKLVMNVSRTFSMYLCISTQVLRLWIECSGG